MIRLLVLDVDGTMTDGGVYYDSTGNELKKFAIKDGAGIVLARAAGMQVMICTGRECEAVRHRAQDLHIDYLFQNVHDKFDRHGPVRLCGLPSRCCRPCAGAGGFHLPPKRRRGRCARHGGRDPAAGRPPACRR